MPGGLLFEMGSIPGSSFRFVESATEYPDSCILLSRNDGVQKTRG